MTEKGGGTGHLVRCARWAAADPRSFLLVEPDSSLLRPLMALPCVASLAEQGRILETLSDSDNFDIVVFDQLKTKETVFRAVSPRASLCIGIDEGGSLRATLPYLIDTLPGPPKRTNPNLFSIGFLDLLLRFSRQAPSPPPSSSPSEVRILRACPCSRTAPGVPRPVPAR
jgi:hypothetical protein